MKGLRSHRLVLGVMMVALAPCVLGDFAISLLNDIGIASMVVLGLILLTGVGGAISFGQAAFVGIAAYASAWLTTAHSVSPWLGLLFALILTGACALGIGALTLRLRGHFLPLSTIAWGLSIPMLFGNLEALGNHSGLSNIPALQLGYWKLDTARSIYYLIWFAACLLALFSYNLLYSRSGRAMRALRGGSTLLASVGADAYQVRLSLFLIAALYAGLAGWLYAHANRFVSPTPFDLSASIEYLLMAVGGGLGKLAGALVGSALVLALKNGLQDVLPLLSARGAQLQAVAFATLFILLLHYARGGLMGFVARRWHRRAGTLATHAPVTAPRIPLARRAMPARGAALLGVHAALKRFGGLVAVNQVSFDVKAGEIVGLIGPNGAGKSTLFNLLTGTLRMSAGSINFLGHEVSEMTQRELARLGLARTFQHVKLRPHMSLLDNVALGAHGRTRCGVLRGGLGLDRAEEHQIFAEAYAQLERIGLAERAHELAGSLPLGTQRILEIARALAGDPVLLVLDEPAAGLRRQEKLALGDLLRRLRNEGMTILIVEHDMDFVMKLVDRLVVMNFGSKLLAGTPAQVRADEQVQAAYLGGSISRSEDTEANLQAGGRP
ncbi:branched-chain amino acid ABC transporter ATP-binding protein/permease [Paraburkholderia caffeinilytica]|uniref:branched-chain amino acid ABC transporter ATP-binding protein/permease n=1 Tax=Paraburkholderia caffeinilytica TaxID=1761016 RepID=UPI0038BDC374